MCVPDNSFILYALNLQINGIVLYFFCCNLLFLINIISLVMCVAVVHLFKLLYNIILYEWTTVYPFPVSRHLDFSCRADSVSVSPMTLGSFLVLSSASRCCYLHLCQRTLPPLPAESCVARAQCSRLHMTLRAALNQ